MHYEKPGPVLRAHYLHGYHRAVPSPISSAAAGTAMTSAAPCPRPLRAGRPPANPAR